MVIDAKYLQTTTENLVPDSDEDTRQFGNERMILYSSNVNNELMTLTKANFIDENYIPKCRLSDLPESDNKFILDEVSDLRIYSTIESGVPSNLVESYSNVGRSRVTSSLLDYDVSAVKFLDKDRDQNLVIDIDEKYIPFLKLLTVVSTGISDFNLIKTMHENSDHPHESLKRDVITEINNDPVFTNENGKITDSRSKTLLGFESESIQFK